MNWVTLAVALPFNEDWWKQVAPSRNEFGLLFTAAGVIALLGLIWAVFVRKREERPARYSYPPLMAARRNGAASAESDSRRQGRRKRKRRHRRNPTLAETGGLPPIRPEGLPDDPP